MTASIIWTLKSIVQEYAPAVLVYDSHGALLIDLPPSFEVALHINDQNKRAHLHDVSTIAVSSQTDSLQQAMLTTCLIIEVSQRHSPCLS